MSGMDISTAGMEDPPLAAPPRVPKKTDQAMPGLVGYRGPQIAPGALMEDSVLRQMVGKIMNQMEAIRSMGWWQQWIEISRFILPDDARFFVSDTNRGQNRYQAIRNTKACRCFRTLSAGMMTGMTSPARPWFDYAVDGSEDDNDMTAALQEATNIVRKLFLGSNLYNELPTLYRHLGGFGTAAMEMVEDSENVFDFNVFPIGSYTLGNDGRRRINRFGRKMWYYADQIVQMFGYANCSKNAQAQYREGNVASQIEVWHYIGPNPNWDGKMGTVDAKFKRYMDVWYEIGAVPDGQYLSMSGHDVFPVLAPRWQATGEDIYGHCPGMMTLPNVKELMVWVKKQGRARDKTLDPPMQRPASLTQRNVGLDPGDETVVTSTGESIKTVHDLKYDFREASATIAKLEEEISEDTYESLFFAITNDQREQPMTAREAEERSQEKLTALGPVLNQVNSELLKPMVERAFIMAWRAGKFAHIKWPDKYQGKQIKVNFVSILAAAQQEDEVVAIDKTTDYALKLAQVVGPSALNAINVSDSIREVGKLYGAPNKTLATDEQVKAKEDAQAKQAQQQAQQQQAAQQAINAKNLAAAKTGPGEQNALTDTTGGSVPGQGPAFQ